MMQNSCFIVSAVRTPIGKFGGAFSSLTTVELGAAACGAALERAGVSPDQVGLTIVGHARQAGNGPNSARQVARATGVPVESPAWTLNQACASGLAAIDQAARAIAFGDAEVVLAAGMENMSRVPYLLEKARWGLRLGHEQLTDAMYRDGLFCPMAGRVMGETVEDLVREFDIDREEQDRFAAESQRKCQAAREAGLFDEEIVPVEVPGRKGPQTVTADEHPRSGVTPESLAKLAPVYKLPGGTGTITAGNASGITDGASALLLVSEEYCERHGLTPSARYTGGVTVGCAPERMGLGPVHAVERLFQTRGYSWDQFDLVEINEAFAAQVLACLRTLPVPAEKLNVNGGAIALGHPIGCTGNRMAVTLLHEMKRRKARRGLAALCVSGGLGIAGVFESVEG